MPPALNIFPKMTNRIRKWIWLLVVLTCVQCEMEKSPASGRTETRVSDMVKRDSSNHQVTIEYAKNFSVYNFENYKIAHLHFRSDHRKILFDQKIILLQKGTPMPDLSDELCQSGWRLCNY